MRGEHVKVTVTRMFFRGWGGFETRPYRVTLLDYSFGPLSMAYPRRAEGGTLIQFFPQVEEIAAIEPEGFEKGEHVGGVPSDR